MPPRKTVVHGLLNSLAAMRLSAYEQNRSVSPIPISVISKSHMTAEEAFTCSTDGSMRQFSGMVVRAHINAALVILDEADDNLKDIPVILYLEPFFAIIESHSANSVAVATVLNILERIVSQVLSPDLPEIKQGIVALAYALDHCRFEASDPEMDQVALVRLLNVIESCMNCSVASLFSRSAYNYLFEACVRLAVIKIGFQSVTPVLVIKDAAHNTIRTIVNRIKTIMHTAAKEGKPAPEDVSAFAVDIVLWASALMQATIGDSGTESFVPDVVSVLDPEKVPTQTAPVLTGGMPKTISMDFVDLVAKVITDAGDGDSDNVLSVALRIIPDLMQIFAFSSDTDKHHAEGIQAKKYLIYSLLLVVGRFDADPPSISCLNSALSAFSDIFSENCALFKLEFEMLMAFVLKFINNHCNDNEKLCEEVLNWFRIFAIENNFITELFINFDCDPRCISLISKMIDTLSRFCVQLAQSQASSLSRLSMDILKLMIKSLNKTTVRVIGKPDTPESKALAERVINFRREKKQLQIIYSTFSQSPEKGIKAICDTKYASIDDHKAIAKFILEHPQINRKALGEFFSKKEDFNKSVLTEFIKQLPSFSKGDFLESLREFMESFTMEGDANIVGRMLETFSQTFYEEHKRNTIFHSSDACYVTSYSIVMLNVDLHNPALKKHMTLQEYIRNTRGVNNGDDIPASTLASFYDSISKNQLCIQDASANGVITPQTLSWMSSRSAVTQKYVLFSEVECNSLLLLMKDAFASRWRVIAKCVFMCLAGNLDQCDSSLVFGTLNSCADILNSLNLTSITDELVSLLLSETLFSVPKKSFLENLILDKKVVSSLGVVFTIVSKCASHSRRSWALIMHAFYIMSSNRLLSKWNPKDFTDANCFPSSETAANEHKDDKFKQNGSNSGGGWFFGLFWSDSEPIENRGAVTIREGMDKLNIFKMFDFTECPDNDFVEVLKNLVTCLEVTEDRTIEEVIYCLYILQRLLFVNKDKIKLAWSVLDPFFREKISKMATSSARSFSEMQLFEQFVSCFLGIIRICIDKDVDDMALEAISSIDEVCPSIAEQFSNFICSILLTILSDPERLIRIEKDNDDVIMDLFHITETVAAVPACKNGISVLHKVIESNVAFNATQYAAGVKVVSCYLKIVSRVRKSGELTVAVDQTQQDKTQQQWIKPYLRDCCDLLLILFTRSEEWELCSQTLTLFIELMKSTDNVSKRTALSYLQHILFSPHTAKLRAFGTSTEEGESSNASWLLPTLLRRVLFPVAHEYISDSASPAPSDVRLGLIQLVTKIALQNVERFTKIPTMQDLWGELITLIEAQRAYSAARDEATLKITNELDAVMQNVVAVLAGNDPNVDKEKCKQLLDATVEVANRMNPEIAQDILAQKEKTEEKKQEETAEQPEKQPEQQQNQEQPSEEPSQ